MIIDFNETKQRGCMTVAIRIFTEFVGRDPDNDKNPCDYCSHRCGTQLQRANPSIIQVCPKYLEKMKMAAFVDVGAFKHIDLDATGSKHRTTSPQMETPWAYADHIYLRETMGWSQLPLWILQHYLMWHFCTNWVHTNAGSQDKWRRRHVKGVRVDKCTK